MRDESDDGQDPSEIAEHKLHVQVQPVQLRERRRAARQVCFSPFFFNQNNQGFHIRHMYNVNDDAECTYIVKISNCYTTCNETY